MQPAWRYTFARRASPWVLAVLLFNLVGCATSADLAQAPVNPNPVTGANPGPPRVSIASVGRPWVLGSFADLPGWPEPDLTEAWSAWVTSCRRPHPAWAPHCPTIRRLSLSSTEDQHAWVHANLVPYQLTQPDGQTSGLLTAYFEPELTATRRPQAGNTVALYRPPTSNLKAPWYSRRDIETLPEARAQLQGKELVYLSDRIDAMILHVQGSAKATITEPDGRTTTARIAFAGTNGHTYQSIGRWLIDQAQLRDLTWPSIKAWAARNPTQVDEMLWSNPRYVFFREEALTGLDAALGPKGAQGVPLTAGRSIAVDPSSVPYGAPVWLHTQSPTLATSRLVIAQDTGGAIVGAIRADYFAGTGSAAGEFAGRIKQPYQAWVLWPKGAAVPR
jgi:membrane-bound lytic murein transglycosylase A